MRKNSLIKTNHGDVEGLEEQLPEPVGEPLGHARLGGEEDLGRRAFEKFGAKKSDAESDGDADRPQPEQPLLAVLREPVRLPQGVLDKKIGLKIRNRFWGAATFYQRS